MGREVQREHFDQRDFEEFEDRLRANLRALRELLARPGFGEGPTTTGAELELNLIDAHGRPARVNEAVLTDARDDRLALELNQFNLEINSTPVPLRARPFSATGNELRAVLSLAQRAAQKHGARIVPVGILPTLTTSDVLGDAMSARARYRVLQRQLRAMRGVPFRIRINGLDRLDLSCDDVTLEGAATSFQLHLRVAPRRFAAVYNAAQIATGLALAVAANSPLFVGHRLWDETRIALFKQAVDDRGERLFGSWPPPRVAFGHGWVRHGIHELFAEAVSMHRPLIPEVSTEDAARVVERGGVPLLDELRLHTGTVWRWNRAIYDPSGDGHVRIELRALPAGPTVIDMMANAAFLLGLTLGLAPDAETLVTELPFAHAEHNFYRAAQAGLEAELLWPSKRAPSPRPAPVLVLVSRLLDTAYRGLLDAGVDDEEARSLLLIIDQRCQRRMTGALWQREALAILERAGRDRTEALHELVSHYERNVVTGRPVHEWPLPD